VKLTEGSSILGTRVVRTEDPPLLLGQARFMADLDLPDKLHAVFVRSEVAHGTLGAIHTAEATARPGVVEVLTASNLGVAPHHGFTKVHDDFARPPLADGRVRFVGEPIAVVLAETFEQGEDAALLIWAEVESLPILVNPEDALAADAPLIFPTHGSNHAVVKTDKPRTDFDNADHVVRGRYVNQRLAVVPMEPDCAAAQVDADGRLILWASTQMPHVLHGQIAAALTMPEDNIRVVTPQVGGGFGGKAGIHPEYTVVAAAAIRTGRPVIWIPPRSDDMKALPHSRGQIQYAELGCTSEGKFAGLRVRLVGDAGAYPTVGAFLPTGTRSMAQGPYSFSTIEYDLAVAVTNTTPMGAYRGAGRPEATAMLERLVDQAARELDIDPIEIRRRNFLDDGAFPYTTFTGNVYDTGRYMLPLERAAELVGYEQLRAEQVSRRERGDRMLLGIGVAAYVEITAGGDEGEFGAIELHADGSATIFAGTQSHGQGHQTTYAMLVADQTGIPIDRITLVDGDTDRVRSGGGTGGSRSLQLGGSAIRGATEAMVDQAKTLAAQSLEADVADIVVDTSAGTVGVAGVPAQALTWVELASQAESKGNPLRGEFDFSQRDATYPFGAHISVVEVDSETGYTRLIRHVAVDDCGNVINPLLVEGQQHGGIAAGVGQALFEEVRYDTDGNPVTSNLADYGIPTAAELPSLEVASTETPTPLNPLGAKGIGEAATVGSTPAVQNAVVDACAHLGVRHIDLPCTPERVWRALTDARSGSGADPWREPPDIFERLRAAKQANLADTSAGESAAQGI